MVLFPRIHCLYIYATLYAWHLHLASPFSKPLPFGKFHSPFDLSSVTNQDKSHKHSVVS